MKFSTGRGYRSRILHFLDTPSKGGSEYFEDGVLLVGQDGRVQDLGSAEAMERQGLNLEACEHFPDALLMPGFIDSHIHSPQTQVMGSYGTQLVDWLRDYTFPAEGRFSQRDYALAEAEYFCDLMLAHGTTTAMVYTSVFAESTQAFFEVAERRNLRMIAGKVMMDRNAPDYLLDTAESSERDSRALIETWHNRGRLHYALTPRFAPTSSPAQLRVAGELYRSYPDLYLQTHLSETREEVAWVHSLFPGARDYLDVYDTYGLLGPRSVFGHGLHLSELELQRLADTDSSIAFCPTSNLFLGSGLLNVERAEAAGVGVSLATDVGGGTSFSMIRTLAEAYKVLQLQGQSLHPLDAFFRITLGNARRLGLDDRVGSFTPGKEADFVVLDRAPTSLQSYRQHHTDNLEEQLFALMTLGDERNIARTYVMGQLEFLQGTPVSERDSATQH